MPLIAPDNSYLLIAILACIAWLGLRGDRRNWFKKVSGILVAMFVSGLLASTKVIPSGSDKTITVPVYDFIFKYFVYLAIPLLLFDVNLKQIWKESGRMVLIFLVGAVGVVAGGLIAAFIFGFEGDDGWKLSSILSGTYIGGTMNFMALSNAFDFTKNNLFPSAVAADNILTNAYFFLLLLLPSVQWIAKQFIPWKEVTSEEASEKIKQAPVENINRAGITEQLLLCIGLSAAIVASGIYISSLITTAIHTDIKTDTLIITIITVIIANAFPGFLKPLKQTAFPAGMFLLYMFLVVAGTNANFGAILTGSPKVFGMVATIMLVHLITVLIAGKLMKFSLYEIGLSSCANISGPAVSVTLAASYKAKSLITPVILVAILGYALGNVAGYLVAWILH